MNISDVHPRRGVETAPAKDPGHHLQDSPRSDDLGPFDSDAENNGPAGKFVFLRDKLRVERSD